MGCKNSSQEDCDYPNNFESDFRIVPGVASGSVGSVERMHRVGAWAFGRENVGEEPGGSLR